MKTKTDMEEWGSDELRFGCRLVDATYNETHEVAVKIFHGGNYSIGHSRTLLVVFQGTSDHRFCILLHDTEKTKRSYWAKKVRIDRITNNAVSVIISGKRQEMWGIEREFNDYRVVDLAMLKKDS